MIRQKSRKNQIMWPVVLVIFVAVGIICYFVCANVFSERQVEDGENEEREVVIDNAIVEGEGEENNSEEIEAERVGKEDIVRFDGDDPNTLDDLTGVVTYAGVSGDDLVIRVNIDQYIASGSCDLWLKKDGVEVFSDASRVIESASTATCEGFSVPISAIGRGKFSIFIVVGTGEKAGKIEGEVSI